ncbi:SPW repeat protein [Rhodoligotrophos defluvii]|uniref:SPW repeat protein n=1 Tax=Rhodoligotrophos defluvii TaxID=2561934 RepID=UPI0010CA1ED6|nr:SPW repeat protein [Rhodoligotrophos defluvii]
MRFIPTKIHGALDYVLGIVLIVSPWLFGFANGGAAQWIPILLGAGVIVYSLFTDYELGVVSAIPMTAHLGLDVVGGLFLAISPWLFGFADQVLWPHLIFGILEVGAGLMTSTTPYQSAQEIGHRM